MDTLERCVVTVTDGTAVVLYRWAGLSVDGSSTLGDDVSEWTDDEIREAVAMEIGAEGPNVEKIEIVWD